MRWALPLTLVVSLSAHVVVATALVLPLRGARPDAPPPPPDPSPQLAGETFELPAPDTTDLPLANASPSPDNQASEAPIEVGDAPARPHPPARGRPAPRASAAGRPSGGRSDPGETDGVGTGTSPALYGAVGERGVADLATAFTRGFPHAASADPAWQSASFGSAGEAIVTLSLDETGHITDMQVAGSPSAPLASGVRRTLALIRGRTFVAHGKTTRLEMKATISADSVHDGLHGDVFAIGGSYIGGEGNAFFALAIGRRIDVRVRAK